MISLVKTEQIKTKVWREKKDRTGCLYFYDEAIDTLILYIENPKKRIVSHPVSDNFSLLYRHKDYELVGIKIHNFHSKFTSTVKFGEIIPLLDNSTGLLEGGKNIGIEVSRVNEAIAISALIGTPVEEDLMLPNEFGAEIEFDCIPA